MGGGFVVSIRKLDFVVRRWRKVISFFSSFKFAQEMLSLLLSIRF